MATEILLPKLDYSMTEGEVVEWLVNDGDTVTEGQLILVLEAEKAANELEAPAAGKLKVIIPAGDGAHSVGTVLGVIE